MNILNLKRKRNYKLILLFCTCLFSASQMVGCTSFQLATTIVNDDVAQKSTKGYAKFDFPTSKTAGEAGFDAGVKMVAAALGGGGSTNYKLEVAKVSNEKETPLFQLRTYDIENGIYEDALSRWTAEPPGKYTYRITFIKPMIELFWYKRIVFGDVTVDVRENQITPVEVYFMDFYDYKGNPKKEEAAQEESKDTPDLDMGTKQIMKEERFHVGDPFPVAVEKNENFADNK